MPNSYEGSSRYWRWQPSAAHKQFVTNQAGLYAATFGAVGPVFETRSLEVLDDYPVLFQLFRGWISEQVKTAVFCPVVKECIVEAVPGLLEIPMTRRAVKDGRPRRVGALREVCPQ